MKFSKFAFLMALGFLASPVFASGYANGKVSITAANTPGGVYLNVTNQNSRGPCATADGFVIDTTKPEGRAMYAVALTAVSQGLSVVVYGSNLCDGPNKSYESIGQMTIISK